MVEAYALFEEEGNPRGLKLRQRVEEMTELTRDYLVHLVDGFEMEINARVTMDLLKMVGSRYNDGKMGDFMEEILEIFYSALMKEDRMAQFVSSILWLMTRSLFLLPFF
jgi:hypothetical protein